MISLRLVLDTDIVVSAALKSEGSPRTVLLLALSKSIHLYVSDPIFQECRVVLSRTEFDIPKGVRRRFLQLLQKKARFVVPRQRLRVTADPNYDIFIECGDVARADYLVTGNLRHFPRYWKATKIITPREFLTLIAPHLLG